MSTITKPSRHQIAELLTDDIISEMTKYLMEDYGYSLEKALDAVYTSKTIQLLQNEDGELYVQSPAYVYDMLIEELGLFPMLTDGASSMVADDWDMGLGMGNGSSVYPSNHSPA